MINPLDVLPIESNALDVLPQEGSAIVEIDSHDRQEQEAIAHITSEQQDGYILNDSIIERNSDGVLYDNDIKILEWSCSEDGRLHVQSYTDKQVILRAALSVKDCQIKAKGPLIINGSIESESTVAIEADSLLLASPMVSKGAIHLNVHQALEFFAPVTAAHLNIHATYVRQEANLQLSDQLEVFSRYFKQNATAVTSANKLRLIADQCEMNGDWMVNEECFLTSNALIWGNDTAQSTFRLIGNNHIHTPSLYLQGDTQAWIGNSETIAKGYFNVDRVFRVNKEGLIHFVNTQCSLNHTENQGELLFDRCNTKSKNILQRGVFEGIQSEVIVDEQFAHHQNARTNMDSCNVISPITEIDGGEFQLKNCIYKGQSCDVYAGFLELNEHSELEIESLFVNKGARTTVREGKVSADDIQVIGELVFEKANVKTKDIKTIKGHVTSKHSNINADELLQLNGVIDLINSRISGKILELEGELSIDKADINADSLTIVTEKALIQGLSAKSRVLRLKGSQCADQVMFKNSELNAQLLTCDNHITLDASAFYGESKEKIAHDLCAHLKLKNSKFITKDDVRNYLSGQLDLADGSLMKAKTIHSEGVMCAKNSRIECDYLLAGNVPIALESSIIEIKDEFSANTSNLVLTQGSELRSATVQLKNDFECKSKENRAFNAYFDAERVHLKELSKNLFQASQTYFFQRFKNIEEMKRVSASMWLWQGRYLSSGLSLILKSLRMWGQALYATMTLQFFNAGNHASNATKSGLAGLAKIALEVALLCVNLIRVATLFIVNLFSLPLSLLTRKIISPEHQKNKEQQGSRNKCDNSDDKNTKKDGFSSSPTIASSNDPEENSQKQNLSM